MNRGHKRRLVRTQVVGLTLACLSLGFICGVPLAVPASAATVIGGCTIVANPTPTSHTRCPNADLADADLSSANLSYAQLNGANLSGAILSKCTVTPPPNLSFSCVATDLTDARLSHALLAGATTSACLALQGTPTLTSLVCGDVNFTGADLNRADLSNTDLSSANLSGATLSNATFVGTKLGACYNGPNGAEPACTGADLSGATVHKANWTSFDLSFADLAGADLTGSNLSHAIFGWTDPVVGTFQTALNGANLTHVNLTGSNVAQANLSGADLHRANFTTTSLVPGNQTVAHTSAKGAEVTWPTPAGQPGATPGSCSRPSGSQFHLGATTVKCHVTDSTGDQGAGTFVVTVT